ncbi:MAG: hypothetical protein U9N87_11600, partial [Planctomycetota bacterium]|nr:hypothetical protein [Planctomycetota bacterium]
AEEPLPSPQLVQEPLAPRTPPSLRPEISSHSNSVIYPRSDYASSDSDDYPSYSPYADSSSTKTAKTPAYQGLNPGPIKVQDHTTESVASSDSSSDYMPETSPSSDSTIPPSNSDNKWPAEMSPKMKYAAKPPLLESSQQWDTERPVVPVARPNADKQTDAARPDSGDSSKNEPENRSDTLGRDDKDAVVRRLPKVDTKRRPIRMSIEGKYSQKPIPVYPSTEH